MGAARGETTRHALQRLRLTICSATMIEQASFCIGSNLVRVDKQLLAISPFGLPGGVHGLSTQIGALRPVLMATALAVCSRC